MKQATHSEEMRQVMVLFEKLDDGIKLLAEGQSAIVDRLDRLELRMDKVESDVADLKSDVSNLKSGQSSLKSDVADLKSGQAQILGYSSRIEDELASIRREIDENYEKKGHDAGWRRGIEERVSAIERSLALKGLGGAGLAKDGKKE